jgi:glycosyltransferase involved in cell wall biosynthesis
MVIAEAGFQNVPAVATDVGGVREFIVDQINGVLVPNEAISIAKTIDSLAKNRGNLEKLGNMARKTTLEKFMIAQFIENHKASYRNFSV